MGCISSKEEVPDTDPHLFRVVNVNDEGIALWSGELAISHVEITLLRPNREPTRWPLQSLRRYGYDNSIFSFESGRRCATGEGIFAFRCQRADRLFQTLQVYLQTPMNTMFEDMVELEASIARLSNRNDGAIAFIRNQAVNLNLSPSGTIQSSTMRSHSTDSLNGESIYMEPTPGRQLQSSRFQSGLRLSSLSSGGGLGPLSPDQTTITPRSPGSPNSIGNHLEMTTLSPISASAMAPGCSNVYQEFTMRSSATGESNNNTTAAINQQKKLSLDIPPQELAPSPSFQAISPSAVVVRAPNYFPSGTLRSQKRLGPQSPGLSYDSGAENEHAYMNVTLSDQSTLPRKSIGHYKSHDLVQTPTASGTITSFAAAQSRLASSTASNTSDLNRVYENLDTAEVRPLLSRSSRFSKPDLFAKPLDHSASDKSEPSTPTMHYIILDLDHTSNSSSSNQVANSPTTLHQPHIGSTTPTRSGHPTASVVPNMNLITSKSANSICTISPSATMPPMSPLPPESPKKGVLDYAKIDFNKTVALSNSANPSSELDSEESRKTRHSSVAKAPIAVNE